MALEVKNTPASAGDVRDACLIPGSGESPGEDKGNTLQYSSLEKPWKEEPGRVQSIGLHRVRHDWSDLAHMYLEGLEQTSGDSGGLNNNNLRVYILKSFYFIFLAEPCSMQDLSSLTRSNSLHWEHRVIYYWTTREVLKFSFGKLFIQSQTSTH